MIKQDDFIEFGFTMVLAGIFWLMHTYAITFLYSFYAASVFITLLKIERNGQKNGG